MSRRLLLFVLVPILVLSALAPFARADAPAAAPGTASATAPAPTPTPATTAARTDAPAAKRGFTEAVPCSACHSTTAWRAKDASGETAKFDHSTTGFPLTGQHIHAACVECHNSARVVKRECVSCHDDYHRGRLSRSCDNCHVPAGWRVTRPLEIHRMTRFPLTGMHVLADCSECHIHASEHRFTATPTDCFACHEKDYRRPGLQPDHVGTDVMPPSTPLPRDCSICHRTTAWVPAALNGPLAMAVLGSPRHLAPAGHDLRFPISFGVHRMAACEDCHASLSVPRAVRCIGCHAHDPVTLMQQHRQPMATDGASCLSCHPGGARR